MIFNLLSNALLACLLHIGLSVVLDAGEAAPAYATATPAQACARSVAERDAHATLENKAGAHS